MFKGLSFVLLLLLTACGGTVTTGSEQTPAPIAEVPATETTAPDPQATIEKIKFKQEDGREVFSFKFKTDGAKLVDGADRELVRLKRKDNRKIEIKDAGDAVLGYVIKQGGFWKLENADQTQELFILRRQEDGDYKLEDGTDRQLYRIKKRDYGFEIETPDKTSLYKVKVKEGKTSLRNANDETVLSTKSALVTEAMACFGLDALSREQQAALAYVLHLAGSQ